MQGDEFSERNVQHVAADTVECPVEVNYYYRGKQGTKLQDDKLTKING